MIDEAEIFNNELNKFVVARLALLEIAELNYKIPMSSKYDSLFKQFKDTYSELYQTLK